IQAVSTHCEVERVAQAVGHRRFFAARDRHPPDRGRYDRSLGIVQELAVRRFTGSKASSSSHLDRGAAAVGRHLPYFEGTGTVRPEVDPFTVPRPPRLDLL